MSVFLHVRVSPRDKVRWLEKARARGLRWRTGIRVAVCLTLLSLILVPVGCGSSGEDGEPVHFLTVDTDADWSPDGQLIAFASSRRLGGLFVIRPDGAGLRQLIHGNASNPDWSPDGRWIAYQGSNGIYVISRHGGRPRRIGRGAQFMLPAWAPDGRTLAVVRWERNLSTMIYVLRPNGSGLRRLLSRRSASLGSRRSGVSASQTEPAWAPGGRQIAFQEGNGRIVVVRIANGQQRIIATGSGEPAWSPDGKTIAFESNGVLWARNADGTGETHLLASNGADPSWAPDSRRLVFEVRHWFGRFWRRPQSLSVVDATGSSIRRLTFGDSNHDDPGWRGDRATP